MWDVTFYFPTFYFSRRRPAIISQKLCSYGGEVLILITAQLFASFLWCKYKAHLQVLGQGGIKSAYQLLMTDLDRTYRDESLRRWQDRVGIGQVVDSPESLFAVVERGCSLITNATATTSQLSVGFEALERVHGDTTPHQYAPVVFTHRERVTGHDRLLAACHAIILSKVLGAPLAHAKIIHGCQRTTTKVTLAKPAGMTEIGAKARRRVEELAAQLDSVTPPPLTLNDHCAVCEFRERCYATAVEKDDLSLLRGLSTGEIEQWRARGVFSVTQLSYTFRAKTVTGKRGDKVARHLPALQALAIREKKIYLARLPPLPEAAATTRVFLDVEGVPDRESYYLIGAAVEMGGETRMHSFWADGPNDEMGIWQGLQALLAKVGPCTVYHYGRYDHVFLDRMAHRYGALPGLEEMLERLRSDVVDVLAAISGNVYFPVYSRSLKVIGTFLGAAWSDPSASGLQSLVWRMEWERTRDRAMKESLLRYNSEDCLALQLLTRALDRLTQPTADCAMPVVRAEDMPAHAHRRFGRVKPAIPAIGRIIETAYFKYQTTKVFFRTDSLLRRSLVRSKVQHRAHRPNSVIVCSRPLRKCLHCGAGPMYLCGKRVYKKIIYDLRFTNAGVRRHMVRYESQRYICGSCRRSCASDEFPSCGVNLGRGLVSWAIYAHVALRQSFREVNSGINELFGYSFTRLILAGVKPMLAREYRSTQELLMAKLRAGSALYVDETKVTLRAKTAYVWVFSNLQEVVYLFSASRDGTILERVLDGFKGVLVSDFYGVYDSPRCEQQKCVVHFVRDLNDDLMKTPLDHELAELAKGFTNLFTPIIETIDRYGLKHRQLAKHKPLAEEYLRRIAAREYRSRVAEGYQGRLRKYGPRLFTFLDHDGVSWNNNVAENAVKVFVSRRRVIGTAFSESGIGDYLLFLSILCTLQRRGGSFLKFLRSGETDVDAFFAERPRNNEWHSAEPRRAGWDGMNVRTT